MDLFSVKTIKELLGEQGAKPRKGLGQNFLTSKGVLGDILKAAQLKRSDTVLEIGPGVGTLTRELALAAKKVVAVEKDKNLVEMLESLTVGMNNIEIINSDILKLDPSNIPTLQHPYKVVANLPYYITSPVIRLFLETENRPDLLVLMVQKEVAQRICARPAKRDVAEGEPHQGREARLYGAAKPNLLSVSVQFYAEPKIFSYVKKNCFWPQPKVDSAILRIAPLINADKKLINADTFFKIVKAGFKQPRKQLLNNLSQELGFSRQEVETWLNQVGIAPTQRAETLSIENWAALTNSLPQT